MILLLLLGVFIIFFFTFRGQAGSEESSDGTQRTSSNLSVPNFTKIPVDCKPHQWQSFEQTFGENIPKLEKCISDLGYEKNVKTIHNFTSRLVCAKCGFISGTEFALDFDRFGKAVSTLLVVYEAARKERPDVQPSKQDEDK